MRAMVLNKLGPIEQSPLTLTDVDRPPITSEDEVIFKIGACGVCRSQLHGIEGDWKKFGIPPALPTIPGHEAAGSIVKVGSKVRQLKQGDRVGVSPLHGSCLNCEYCSNGKEQLCDSVDVTGESMEAGGYTEYMKVSESFATKVPDSYDDEHAAPLFCAGITAFKAVVACEPQKDKSVGIFGVGGVGHMAVQFANYYGMNVVGISRSKGHLDVAKRLGASSVLTYDASEEEFLEKLQKDQRGGDGTGAANSSSGLLDKAIVFAPNTKVTDTAVKSVKKGGIIVTATFENQPEIHAFEEKTIRGTLIGSRKDMQECMRVANEAGINVITKSYPLEKANDVLTMLKNSQIEARAVLTP